MGGRSKSECEISGTESDSDIMLDLILKSYIFVGQLHLRSIDFKIKYNMVSEQAHNLRPRLSSANTTHNLLLTHQAQVLCMRGCVEKHQSLTVQLKYEYCNILSKLNTLLSVIKKIFHI